MLPTYLYIKEHSLTGMRYLGKTTKKDPYKYNGSGKYWIRHIKKYGKKYIKTLWVSEIWNNKDDLREFALLLSEELDIVNSDKWANLKPENGNDGGGDWSHVRGKKQTPEHLRKLSESRKGRIPWNKGIPATDDVKDKLRKNHRTKKGYSPWNKGLIGVQPSTRIGIGQKRVMCPHCNKEGGYSVMSRWHFDNCRVKGNI